MTETNTGAPYDDTSSGEILAMYATEGGTPDDYSIPRTVPLDHAAAAYFLANDIPFDEARFAYEMARVARQKAPRQ